MAIMGTLKRWLRVEPEPVKKGASEVEQAYLAYVQEMEDSYGIPADQQYTPVNYSLERKGTTDAGTLWCVCDPMYGYVYVLDTGSAAEVFLYKSADGEKLVLREDFDGLTADLDELGNDTDAVVMKWFEGTTVEPEHPEYVVVKSDAERRYTLGVAYPADEVDSHGDFTDAAQLEETAWNFMAKSQNVGLDHAEGTDFSGVVVESYIYRGPDWVIGDEKVEAGDWMLGAIWNEDAWDSIKRGERTGWSIQGVAMIDQEAEAPDA